jgi:Fe-S oxidoreductase
MIISGGRILLPAFIAPFQIPLDIHPFEMVRSNDFTAVRRPPVSGYLYGYPVREVTREFFFNVSDRYGVLPWIVLALCAGALVWFFISLARRFALWKQGSGGISLTPHIRRIAASVKELVFLSRILREGNGIAHFLIFYGFAGSVILLIFAAIQQFITKPFKNILFITGDYYLGYTLADDILAVMILVGVALSLFRRKVIRPSNLITLKTDMNARLLAGLFALTGILSNALRIAITDFPDFEIWAPISFGLSHIFSFFSESSLYPAHYGIWWIHILIGLVVVVLGVSPVFRGIVVAMLNVYAVPVSERKRATRRSVPLSENSAVNIADFTAKDLMDLDACTGCGRCDDNCPAYLAQKPLSPGKLIRKLSHALGQYALGNRDEGSRIGAHVSRDEIWSCTMCGACVESCPSRISHVKKIVGIRKGLAAAGELPEGVSQCVSAVIEKGTPFPSEEGFRSNWFSDIEGVKPMAENASVDYLYFAGCAVSDPAVRNASRATLSLLIAGGLSVGVLGDEERCCGDMVLRSGREDLFRDCAKTNLDLFAKYGVKKIVTSCPHGFNVIDREYRTVARELGIDATWQVLHHTQLLHHLLSHHKLKVTTPDPQPITWHDPCFTGRYHGIFHAPRALLKGSPKTILVEMPRSKRNSFCCGGSLRWSGTDGDPVAAFRARDIHSTGARVVVTGCPHCVTMLRKGLQSIGVEHVRVCDIAEYISGSV